MTKFTRPRFPPPMSPPPSYTAANDSMDTSVGRPLMDRFPLPYQSHGQSVSPGIFHPNRIPYTTGYHGITTRSPFSLADNSYSSGMSASYHEPNQPRQEGPPFGDTRVIHHVYTVRNHNVVPDISASIQKGFFQVDRKWTCYRRNYFAVTCSFAFKNHAAEGPYYLSRGGQRDPIHQFAVSISAKTASTNNGESEARGLVQHTPKRDKATESVPGRHPILPTPPQGMSSHGMYASSSLYGGSQHMTSTLGYGSYDGHSSSTVPMTHTFERIQFQKATANNGKRRAQQQYFLVVVELSANIGKPHGEENWVIIATKESDQMVVRGRSPGHYKDNGRRDSQTSMGDPDRECGHGGSSQSGSLPLNAYGGHSMDWAPSHRGSGHYSTSSYRQAADSEYSPTSLASSSTLTGTPTDLGPSHSGVKATESVRNLTGDHNALTPLSESSEEIIFGFDRSSLARKRPYDEDETDANMRYQTNGSLIDNSSSVQEFATMPYSRLLCASS